MPTEMILAVAGVLIVALAVGLLLLSAPQERWLEAGGERIWRLPANAEILEENSARAEAVRRLKRENRLWAFQGETVGTGTPQDREVAKLKAYEQLAEFIDAKVTTFAQLVEGQLQSVQLSTQSKEQVRSASVSAYKRVTQLLASAQLSGAYVYAVWRVRDGNAYRIYALLIFDPNEAKEFILKQADVAQTVNELGRMGVDFFKALNAVIEEAIKGTPLTVTAPAQPQPTPQPQPQPTPQPQPQPQPSPQPQPAPQPQPQPQPKPAIVKPMKAVGEAYGNTELEAEEKAKKAALANLSEQLYVDVKTVAQLRDQLTQVVSAGRVTERLQTVYERTIETKSQFEFVDPVFNVLERKTLGGRFYAKVEVIVDEDNTKGTFETYISLKLANTLLDGKMVFSAKSILDRYEPMVSKLKFPPGISQEIASFVGRIKNEYAKVESLIKTINASDVRNVQEALTVADRINELDASVVDLPANAINRERLREFLRDVRITVSGPSEVLLGEQVTLQVSVSNQNVGSLRVLNEKAEGPDLLRLSVGAGRVATVVKATDSKVTFSLAGIVAATWSPGKVALNPDVLRVVSREPGAIRILAGGTTRPGADAKVTRDRAVKDALVKIVRKAAAEVLVGRDRDLLDVPIDDYIVNKVVGGIDYEITASGEFQGMYFAIVDAKIETTRFEEDIKDALRKVPMGFALLVVEGDTLGYVEPSITKKLVDSGIKLVSKEFSRKLLEEQQRLGYGLGTLSRLAALSAARYVLYTKANVSSTYVADYRVYSVRMLVTTQIVDSITGTVLAAPQFEDVNSGATMEAAASKIVNGQKFLDYVQDIVNSLNFETAEVKKAYKYTFVLERVAYGSILLDYLRARVAGIREIERVDTKLVIETPVEPAEMERLLKGIDTLRVRKVSDFNYQVTR